MYLLYYLLFQIALLFQWHHNEEEHLSKFAFIRSFIENKKLFIREHLPAACYTYRSEAWHTKFWLDHCITTADGHDALIKINTSYIVFTIDHIPFQV